MKVSASREQLLHSVTELLHVQENVSLNLTADSCTLTIQYNDKTFSMYVMSVEQGTCEVNVNYLLERLNAIVTTDVWIFTTDTGVNIMHADKSCKELR